MIKKILYFSSFLILLFSDVFSQSNLRIATAANLLYPLKELEIEFENESGLEIEIISASSGVLYNQIKNGAPYDVYLSANKLYPELLHKENICSAPQIFIYGQLIFWSKNPISEYAIPDFITKLSPRTLAVAHKDLAPFGTVAHHWITDNLNINIENKLVIGENIGQVNRYIYSGVVDAAFTGNSAMHSEQLGSLGNWLILSSAEPVPQSACIIQNSKQKDHGERFLEFLLSTKGQSLLINFGYLSVDGEFK